jgi:hypothetical protein
VETWTRALIDGGAWGSAFEEDVLIDAEFSALFAGARPFARERRLMLAILEDAVTCYRKHRWSQKSRARRLYDEAREWLESTERTHLFAFESICDALEIDPGYVRRLLSRDSDRRPRRGGRGRRLAS